MPELAAILKRVSGQKVRPYSTFDFGRAKDLSCCSVVVPKDRAEPLVYELRRNLLPGFVAFLGTTRWLGEKKHDGVEVVVGNGNSQFDILRLARSDARNGGMDTEDIIRKLEVWHDTCGIDIFQAETDTIELHLLTLPDDVQSFAKEVYGFCPDIVDQGVGSVEALENTIKDHMRVYLWWD
jgi:hypothetical protein